MKKDKEEMPLLWIRTRKETRDHWHAIQLTNHERLFPFSDNLTTLMVIVASERSEAQRERLTSSLSLQGVNVTVLHR